MHSNSLVEYGEGCSEWNLSCKTAVWSWSPCCRSVSASCQSSYSLRHLYVEQKNFFSLPWGAMLNFQRPVWASESNNTKFNKPAHPLHLVPCNTNESHDILERKWLIGPNLDIFTQGCTHFCGQRFRHQWLCVDLFWGDSKFTLLYKLYTHYFTL